MKRFFVLLIILAFVVAGLVGFAYYSLYYYPQQQSINYYNQQLNYMGYFSGMMGGGMMGGGGGMYHMMGYHNGYVMGYEKTVEITQAISMMKNIPSYAEVFANNDTLVFNSTHIVLFVLTMGHGRAVNLTGYTPPPNAHATDNVFVIYGLINPTLIIPQGATVQFIVINLDAGDYHNIAITPLSPPYPYYVMMYVRMDILGMSPLLPHADFSTGQAYEFTFTTVFSQPGIYYYLCEYAGHAEMSMYGQIIVS